MASQRVDDALHGVRFRRPGTPERGGRFATSMIATSATRVDARPLPDRNRRFYDALWSQARLIEPRRFNTWPIVQGLCASNGRRLEVAPGLRPRLPIDGTQFVDISAPALAKLRARGARTVQGEVTALPFPDATFDFVCAFDIVEHVDDDHRALAELTRVARPGAALLISTPLHATRWTPFDELVGHKRRYDPQALLDLLARHDLTVERSAAYGMQPRSSRLLDFGMWWLSHHPDVAMRWYNRAFMPIGLHFQKPLAFSDGMIETGPVDEILLICRRRGERPA